MKQTYTLDFSFPSFPPFAKKIIGFERYQEGINENYGIHLIFRTPRELPLKAWLGELGEIRFSWKGQETCLGGVLKEYTQKHQEDGFEYACRFISPVESLQFQYHSRVFVNRTLEDILKSLFKETPHLQVQAFFQKQNNVCEFIPQYIQSDYEFFKWLVKTYSLYYYTVYQDKGVKLIIADSLQALPTKEKKLMLSDGEGFISEEVLTTGYEKTSYLQGESQEEKINITTEDCTLSVGDIIELNNDYYRVCQKKEVFSVGEGLAFFPKHIQTAYQQSLQLIPMEYIISAKNFSHNPLLYPLEATIASPDNIHYLDESGGYRAQFLFDKETTHPIQGSHSLKKLQPYGGENVMGFHFPITPKSDSVAGFIDDDRRYPFLLGILFSEINPSPVTSLNSRDHVWKSCGGNTMLFHEDKQKAYFTLHTLHQLQIFMFMETEKSIEFLLVNKTGNIAFFTKESLIMQNDGDDKAFITGKNNVKIGGTFTGSIVKGDMKFSAGTDMRLLGKEDVSMKTEKEMLALSSQNISLISQEDFLFSADKGESLLQCLQGKLSVCSQGNVLFHSEEGDITLLNGNASIALRANGTMSIKASFITFKAEDIVIQNPVGVN